MWSNVSVGECVICDAGDVVRSRWVRYASEPAGSRRRLVGFNLSRCECPPLLHRCTADERTARATRAPTSE